MKVVRFLALLVLAAACQDSPVDPLSELTLVVEGPGDLLASAERVSVLVDGSVTRSLSSEPGDPITVPDLEPGEYQVSVEGWAEGVVAWFATTDARLEEGDDVVATLSVPGPFAPDSVLAVEDAGTVALSWGAVPGAAGYRVEASGLDGAGSDSGVWVTPDTAYSVGPLEPGGYRFRVWAVNPLGNAGRPGEAGAIVAAAFTLTVARSGDGEGTVTSSPSGLDCGETCVADFPDGSEVTLTAVAEDGSAFEGWGAPCSGVGTCLVTVDQHLTVEAPFAAVPSSFSLTLGVEEGQRYQVGSVVALVDSEPVLTCAEGESCSREVPAGAEVTVDHIWPEETDDNLVLGVAFGGWAGACNGFEPCVLAMDSPKEVTATQTEELTQFVIEVEPGRLMPHRARVDIDWGEDHPVCWGSVIGDGSFQWNGSTCAMRLAPGTPLTLTSSERRIDWTRCDQSDDTSCEVVVPGGRPGSSVEARWFLEPPPDHWFLTVDNYVNLAGDVDADISGIYSDMPIRCGLPSSFVHLCVDVYSGGTAVSLTATPAAGYAFVGWEGDQDCEATNPCTVVMDQPRTIRPIFEAVSGTTLGGVPERLR